MRKLRPSLLLAAAAFLASGIATTSASSQLAPPFASTAFDRTCGLAASGAPGCSVTGSASAGSGDVAAATALVSPQSGMAPWSADASSVAFVEPATYHLSAPVPRLDFTITIHVDQASITLRNPTTPTGSPTADYLLGALVDPALNHWVQVDVLTTAHHAQCSSCAGGTDVGVLHTLVPATLSTSGQDYVLQMSMTNASAPTIPAGDVTIQAGVSAEVTQYSAPGDDVASIQAVVTSIVVS